MPLETGIDKSIGILNSLQSVTLPIPSFWRGVGMYKSRVIGPDLIKDCIMSAALILEQVHVAIEISIHLASCRPLRSPSIYHNFLHPCAREGLVVL